MNKFKFMAGAAAMFATALSGSAMAGTATVGGNADIYQIFGHAGNLSGGDYGAATAANDAVLVSNSVVAGQVFQFSATGTIGCCSGLDSSFTPDGRSGGTNILGVNGLSNISGNSQIPLVGVFTSDTDPFSLSAPAAFSFDALAPTSAAPLLRQVFYIGDGLTGFNSSGSELSFTAPTGATRLYLGVIDSFGFGGYSGYYNDNPGSFAVSFSSTSGVPEPTTWAMMLVGFGLVGFAMRKRSNVRTTVSYA